MEGGLNNRKYDLEENKLSSSEKHLHKSTEGTKRLQLSTVCAAVWQGRCLSIQ